MSVALLLDRVMAGEKLAREDSAALFDAVIKGEMSDVEIAALLVALKTRGETAEEIAGAALALREGARSFPRPDYKFADIVGTGGDGANTINISSAAAFVVAEAGLPVAKHGNRSVSSKCGAADLMARFGVKLDMTPERARALLDALRVTFLFAPYYHTGFKHAMPVRNALATRTVFNVLGPLINPARPPIMLVGVYDASLCGLVAETLRLLGCERALVVNGLGLDEIAAHGETNAAELLNGEIAARNFTPSDFGVKTFPLASIVGGGPEENEEYIRAVLGGHGSDAHAAAISVNAAALLTLGGVVPNYKDGFALAQEVLKSGRALERLEKFAALSSADNIEDSCHVDS
ncbi:MAG: anthranilate phosphoribosyltransferase [Synergistaceae bacterium]|nr:anthranilate phosphoribosyltransferase [Synergistaceae bacterium]